MLSAFCASAVAESRMEQKITKDAKVSERPPKDQTFVNFVSFCLRCSEFWVIFINLTSSFWVCASMPIPARTAWHSDAGGRACIDALLLDPFYGVQGKFSEPENHGLHGLGAQAARVLISASSPKQSFSHSKGRRERREEIHRMN